MLQMDTLGWSRTGHEMLYIAKNRGDPDFHNECGHRVLVGMWTSLGVRYQNMCLGHLVRHNVFLISKVVSSILGGREVKMSSGTLLLASLAPGWLIGCVINVGHQDIHC